MLRPGDVVLAQFRTGRRCSRHPAVVIASQLYLSLKLDVVVSELTTRLEAVNTPLDYTLQDWAAAGLPQPVVFRLQTGTVPVAELVILGRLSERDWCEVQQRVRLSLTD